MTQVFISYSRKDLTFVEHLAHDLRVAGLEVWYDLSGLEVGMHWGIEIQDAIKRSQYVVIVISPNSIVSEWVEREFIYADNRKLKIVPLIYQQCELPLWAVTLHYVDMEGKNYETNFGELLKVLGVEAGEAAKHVRSPQRPRPAPKFYLRWLGIGGIAVIIVLFFVYGVNYLAHMSTAPQPSPTAQAASTLQLPSATLELPTETPTATLVPTPTPGIGSTMISEHDGMTLLYVPAGNFLMGSTDSDPHTQANEKPLHTVYLDAFWVDRTDIINAMYAKCVRAGACQPPTSLSSSTHSSYYGNSEFDNYPVIYVDWNMAKTYCQWAGRQLPTEAQWEKAARGTDGRAYSWGNNQPLINMALLNYSIMNDTTQVDAHPDGASPYSALDMAGNVFQWVNDWYGSYYATLGSTVSNPQGPSSGDGRVLRGSSWEANSNYDVRSAIRGGQNPLTTSYDTGLRCARGTQ